MLDYFDLILKNNINDKVLVRYSAYNLDKNGVPINNLYDIAIEGKVIFNYKYNGLEYVSDYIKNPRWIDVCKLANDMILKLNVKDKLFLEGISDVHMFSNVITFYMGS